ncbi:MAG: hypothetical protein U1E25_12335 [Methylocystis sp.]
MAAETLQFLLGADLDRERDKIAGEALTKDDGRNGFGENHRKGPSPCGSALYFLGVMLLRMAKFEEAACYLTRAARLQPAVKPEIHTMLGVTSLQRIGTRRRLGVGRGDRSRARDD